MKKNLFGHYNFLAIIIGCVFAWPVWGHQMAALTDKPWHVLGFFDGENAELERICEYNINQLELVDPVYAKVAVAFDRPYRSSRDSSILIYDIRQDSDASNIISSSVSMGERDMAQADVLDEFLTQYLGPKNILIIKAHGFGIIAPAALKIGYNSNQDPLVIRQVLEKRHPERPLDVMIFDSCNMASIEVAYEFKGLVSVMVASQDLMYYSIDVTRERPYSSRPGIDYVNLVLNLTPFSNPLSIGKEVVANFTELVSQKDALYNKATISALDLDQLDVRVFRKISRKMIRGIKSDRTRRKYITALKETLETAGRFQPIGRDRILTYYDLEDFLHTLEQNLGRTFERPEPCVIQSYSNAYVQKATGLSIFFFKDLSGVSSVRRKDLFDKYSRSRFARATGWDKLIKTYHNYVAHADRIATARP